MLPDRPPRLLVWLGAAVVTATTLRAAPDPAFFEAKIRPVLVASCFECHAAGAKKVGGNLRLDSRDGLRRGGVSGPAVVPGNPEASLLRQALRWEHDLEMPPDEPLPEAVIADFETWIAQGAPDPRDHPAPSPGPASAVSPLWSIRPIQAPSPPSVRDSAWPLDPLDRFVLAGLESRDLRPATEADPVTLARRLAFDLHGIPPDPAETEAFMAEHRSSPRTAWTRLVDRLLESPAFGERWGRHWLDVARYAESNGNDGLGRNPTFPHAWRYRDYVIDAFNRDLPFDRFALEQIAGDLLPSSTPAERDRQLVATGFLALGAKPAKAMNANFAMDVVADQIDVVTRGFLGLTVACARCHDHKSDPIPTRDYYALAGIFTSTETLWGAAGHEGLSAPPTDLHVLQAAPRVPPPPGFVETVLVIESNTGKPKPPPKPKWEPGTPLAMGVRDHPEPADTRIHPRGEGGKLGESVPRGFLSTWCDGSEPPIPPGSSGRLELARWITRPSHPLTARVFVNRVWLHLFGSGLVRTPDDFGALGEAPSDVALLDHLAHRFLAEGWSVKTLVRHLVLSRTYQLASHADAALLAADPENRLFGRHATRRLDAESLRDAILAVTGTLDLTPPEGSLIRHRDILLNLAGNLHLPSRHRSVYLCYLRGSPPPELAPFNLPEFTSVSGKREAAVLPTQGLHLLNHPFMVEHAGHWARALTLPSSDGDDDSTRIRSAFRRAFLRPADASEVRRALDFLDLASARTGSRETAWNAFCHALLASNEFRHVN
jgi:cytochrome c553